MFRGCRILPSDLHAAAQASREGSDWAESAEEPRIPDLPRSPLPHQVLTQPGTGLCAEGHMGTQGAS